MKTLTLNLVKKNRVYFKCLTTSGHEVKLKINEKSENLPLGTQELLVNDISVRTKYGTDVIYEVEAETKDVGICTLQHRYNAILVEKCRNLGGQWDAATKTWVFSKIVESEVEELDSIYNSDVKIVKITALREINGFRSAACFIGYPIAKAYNRDSGAKLSDDVMLIEGKIDSSGSMKNWHSTIQGGSVFKLMVSEKLLKTVDAEKWKVEILN